MSEKSNGRTRKIGTRHRRRFLQGVGATGIAGVLAGCLGGDDGDENGNENGNGEENGDDENGTENGDDPASFSVSEVDPAETSVMQGESVTITATIENTGGEEGTQGVALSVDGEEVGSEELTLGSGDSGEVSFDVETGDFDAGDYEYTVSTDDDDESGTLTVEEPAPAHFNISGIDPGDGSVTQGDSLEFGATIANTGDEEGTQDVVLTLDGDELGSEELTLSGGDFDNISLGEHEIGLEPGDYEYEVTTDDDASTGSLTVEEPPLISAPYGLNPGGELEEEEPQSEVPVVIDGLEFVSVSSAEEVDALANVSIFGDDPGEDWFTPPAQRGSETGAEIAETEHDALYQTELFGLNLGYEFQIENGTYDVILHNAEVWHGEDGLNEEGGEGSREFDVMVQGETVVEGYDIYAETGGANIADTITVEGVEVTDETLTIESETHADFTKFCGIEIRWGGDPTEFKLQAHYPFDGDEPTDAVGDLDGEIEGDVSTGAEGVVGDAYQFNGGRISLPEFGLDGGSASLSLWCNADVWESDEASQGMRCLTFWGDDAPQFEVVVGTNGTPSAFYWNGSDQLGPFGLGDDGNVAVDYDAELSTGEWHHFVMSYNDATGTWTLYVDGEEIHSMEEDIDVSHAGSLNTIGDHTDGSLNRFFEGRLDDVRFYTRALTAEDVQALYDLADE